MVKEMQSEQLKQLVVDALEDLKAVDIVVMDVRNRTSITDYMIVAGATSSRHLKGLAANVSNCAREQGVIPLGMEGERGGEWGLIDLGDVVVHVLTQEMREFYQLEKLWGESSPVDDA